MAALLRVALIGAGMYGRFHARWYSEDPRTELVWVWGHGEKRRSRIARDFACSATGSLEEAIMDDSVDIVSIVTPDPFHYEPTMMALRADKHVLVEKPMATVTRECEEMIAEADKHADKVLRVNFHQRCGGNSIKMKELIDGGVIGKPVSAQVFQGDCVTLADRFAWTGKSGPHWFLMSHALDLINWLFSREPVSVFGCAHEGVLAARGHDCFDTLQAQFDYGDAMAQIETSWILPEAWSKGLWFGSMTIYGEMGRIGRLPGREGLILSTDKHEQIEVPDVRDEPEGLNRFIKCVLGEMQNDNSPHDGLVVTRALEAAEESARTGKLIRLC